MAGISLQVRTRQSAYLQPYSSRSENTLILVATPALSLSVDYSAPMPLMAGCSSKIHQPSIRDGYDDDYSHVSEI